jgi:apolipoprotein N-acyltransferase
MGKISIGERKVIHGDISFWNGTSFYTAFGDIFAMLCTIVICIVLGIGWFRNYLK